MSQEDIIVYISDQCPQCDELVSQLEQWHISYQIKNISRNSDNLKELQKKKVYGTPATFIEDQKILGFQKNKLKQALGMQSTYFFDHQQ